MIKKNKDNLINQFVDESLDSLDEVINLSISLKDRCDLSSINSIFRILHTIKGNSAILGLFNIKKLAHCIENIAEIVRSDISQFNDDLPDLLIGSLNFLHDIISKLGPDSNNLTNEYQEKYDDFLQKLEDLQKSMGSSEIDLNKNFEDLIEDMMVFNSKIDLVDKVCSDEFKIIFDKAREIYNSLDRKEVKDNVEDKRKIKDPISEIKEILSVDIEDELDQDKAELIRKCLDQIKINSTDKDLEVVETAIEAFDRIVPAEGFTPFLSDVILEKMEFISNYQNTILSDVTPRGELEKEERGKVLRISEGSINEFIDGIAELIIMSEMYGHIHKRLEDKLGSDKEVVSLKKNNEMLSQLSNFLQKSILEIRKVSVEPIAHRLQRVVYEVAQESDKDIKLEYSGEKVLIDNSLFERLENSLIHMVRNAADHGIESTIERVSRNKNPMGRIFVGFKEEDDDIIVSVEDDGRGIAKDKILKKALEKQIITKSDAEKLSDNEICQLMLMPGITTKEQVTDFSGRGVGLDVVNENLKEVNGLIVIESREDCGTKFLLRIPKTVCVKIIKGFLVRVRNYIFAIPMLSVGESFRLNIDDISVTPTREECILRHDKVFPVIRLKKLLSIDSLDRDESNVGVMVNIIGKDVVLLVDEILGNQQIVVKDIKGIAFESDLIIGGAILGNDKIAIVLNLEKAIK